MSIATQRAVLDAIGIDWYVRRDLIVEAPVAPSSAVSPNNVVNQPKNLAALVEPESRSSPVLKTPAVKRLNTDTQAVLNRAEVEPAPETPQPEPPKPQRPIEAPFNWLVAESGRVLFVCDIKQAKLNGVWHAAAIELLGDIAIAMGSSDAVTSRYFNWPIMTPNGMPLHDVELEGFLEAFLEPRYDASLFIVMGETAQRLAQPVVATKGTLVLSPTLGELFKQPESKQALWQRLKTLR